MEQLTSRPDTVVLIDGYGMAGWDWTPWKERCTTRGLRVFTPGWPGAGVISEYYACVLEALPTPPIVMGHGFGARVVQDLLEDGYGAVGVAIDASAVLADADLAPLLLIGGGFDQLAPASLAAAAYKRHYRGGLITEYAPAGDADYALDWALAHAIPSADVLRRPAR